MVFRARQRSKQHALAFLASAVCAVVFTWPLAPHAADHVLRAAFAWDAYTNAMILGSRVDAAIGRGPLSLFDAYYFAPLPHAIVFNENHFGLSLIFAPAYLLTENPLLAYNATLLISLGLSVFFAYLLVERLTGSALAGLLAGIAFAFSPYVVFELGRIQLVATQWIPLSFYFLHRAIDERRLRDAAGFWLAYLLQVGTCLYYAMFLLPLLAATGLGLWARERPSWRTARALLGLGVVAAAVALLGLRPYFSERKHFALERSLAFAASYDGKLAFFGNVPATNLGLPWLPRPENLRGAHEEIAFPSFTVLALVLFGAAAGALRFWRSGATVRLRTVARMAGGLVAAAGATLLLHSMLAGFLVVVGLAWLWRRELPLAALTRGVGLYAVVLCLAVLLFLGLEPLSWRGSPVHGLYYYLYTYVPGFDGIRKVSRQAVMTTLLAAVVASYGCAALLARITTPLARGLAAAGLFAALTFELRSFPHPLEAQWAGATVPSVYEFLARLPKYDLIAAMPQDEGRERFRGDAGMALHNYLALYHKHRFLDGQSSYFPPVTDLVRRALADLPSESAYTILRTVGADHLLVHGGDLPASRQDLVARLEEQTTHYRREFQQGDDSVLALLGPPPRPLAAMPPLPAAARRLSQTELRAASDWESARARYATDGNPSSFWSSRRLQTTGQALEVSLAAPHRVVALEIENPGHELFLPMSYTVETSAAGGAYRTVAREPELVLFHAQIYAPRQFVFRVVLPEPVEADRLRLVVDRPMPGIDIVVHELHVYVNDSPASSH